MPGASLLSCAQKVSSVSLEAPFGKSLSCTSLLCGFSAMRIRGRIAFVHDETFLIMTNCSY